MFQLNRIVGKGNSSKKSDKPAKTIQIEARLSEWEAKNSEKIAKLIKMAKESYSGLLVPEIDSGTAKFGYKILRELENCEGDFLDTVSELGILARSVHNKFLVCPEHRSSFLLSVRISCPKCNSIDVEKLNLLEHRACGFISERKYFENNDELKCPSCKKQIKNQEKELRLPASWYLCNDCKDKFDEAKINLHCNEFDHDFAPNQAGSVVLYSYTLSDNTTKSPLDHRKLNEEITKILAKHNYTVTENHTINGKSGINHTVDIVGTDASGQSVFVFINNLDENNSEIDSKLLQILDTAPKVGILIGFSSISEKTKSIAAKYNLSIVSSQNIDEIIAEVKKIVSAKIKKSDGDKTT